MQKYASFFKTYVLAAENRSVLIVAIVSMLVTTLLGFLSPLVSKYVMDALVSGNNAQIDAIILYAFAAMALSVALGLTQNRIIIYVTQKIAVKMRIDYFNILLRLGGEFQNRSKEGELQFRMFSDVMMLAENASVLPLNVFFNVLFLIIANVVMAVVDIRILLFVNIVVIINIAVYFLINKRIELYTKSLQTYSEYIYGCVQDQLSKIPLIQMYRSETNESQHLKTQLEELQNRLMTRNIYTANMNVIYGAIFSLWSVGLLWLGSRAVSSGQMTLGDLSAFISLTGIIMPICTQLTSLMIKYPTLKVSLDRFYEIMGEKEGQYDLEVYKKIGHLDFDIMQVINVKSLKVNFWGEERKSLTYTGDLRFEPNKINLISGKSGRGKSTLLKILSRIILDFEGNIFLGNDELRQLNYQKWREQVKYVDISNPIFNGTIWDNITLGRPNATKEEVLEICDRLGIKTVINSLQEGLNARIGKNGINLSDGEKQRIALARCLISNPQILMLDEVGTNVDTANLFDIYSLLRELSAEKTIIMATHRVEAIDFADNIIDLNDKVREDYQ